MKRPWTPWELETLAKRYPDHTAKALSLVLDRAISAIYGKAKQLGLAKSTEFYAGPNSGRTDGKRGRSARFHKGHVPANKGQRRPGYAPGRMAETQFKKGEMAGAAQHNYVPIGSLRVTKYGALERKVTDDPALYPARRWRPVAHLVWEDANGPIPPGHVVRFKPGMHTTVEVEITLDRLECITLAENMRRNTLHRYPTEIKDAIRARAVLNRRINHVEKASVTCATACSMPCKCSKMAS
jgi:hypothetical protein